MTDIKVGDIICFKGEGPMFRVLSFLLSCCDPGWRKLKWKPWHMAILWEVTKDGYWILQATMPSVMLTFFSWNELKFRVRFYHWLDVKPTKPSMDKFYRLHYGKSYDVVIYFWTSIQYLIRHFINHRIPRLLDDRFTCWELASEFCDEMGKPWESKYDCPMIVDFLRTVGEVK